MNDIEFRVLSDRREGLLLELGRLILASGFTLQRQRMTKTDEGVVLMMTVRGPEAGLLALEDRIGSHPLVQSFEAVVSETPRVAQAEHARARTTTDPHAAVNGSTLNGSALNGSAHNGVAATAGPDHARVEILLPLLAREYPDIFPRVIAFEHEVAALQRETTTRYAGTRVGAWIYKREYALGARLNLGDSVKHIALPAMRHLLNAVELHGDTLRVGNSPFTGIGLHRGVSCHFLKGCLEGMLGEPGHLGRPRVVESFCRNTGADACTFAFVV